MTRRISSNATRALAWIWAAFVVSCSTLSLAEDFSVKDSGRQVADHSRLFWLDNERVLFQGPDGTYVKRADGFQQALYRLYVWNTRTGDIKQGERIGGGLCYKDGFVRYWRWKLKEGEFPKESEWYAGTFGAEVRVPREATNPKNFNWDTCKPYSELPPPPEWTLGLAIRWLRPEDGFLVLGSSRPGEAFKNSRISYCPLGEKARCVETPLKRRESRGFDWVSFEEAYFIVGDYFHVMPRHPDGGYNRMPWPEGLAMPVWWLYPDGRVREIELPSGPWLRTFVFPSRVGMLTIGRGPTKWEHSLYLVRSGGGEAVLHGLFHAQAISPDGCLFAVDHDAGPIAKKRSDRYMSLKVVELCLKR